MATKPTLSRKFKKPFILSETKLIKINDIVEKRFDLIRGERNLDVTYNVALEKGRKHAFKKLESVLELDNPVNNKIIDMSIEWEIGSEEDENRSSIFVYFDSEQELIMFNSIYIMGKAEDASWLNETIAEIEEQIERTIPQNIIHKFKSIPFSSIIFPLLVLLGLLTVMGLLFTNPQINKFSLSNDDVQLFIEMNESINSTDDKIDFIYSVISKGIENTNKSWLSNNIRNPSTYFIIIPFMVIVLIFLYLYKYCYPSFVFEWGDFGQYHQTLIERRKYLWGLIIGSLIIGILANLFVFGLSKSISP